MHQIKQILDILDQLDRKPRTPGSSKMIEQSLEQIRKIALTYENRMVLKFKDALDKVKKGKWDRIFVGIDIHETCMMPTWSEELSTKYYPFAKEVLQFLSNHKLFCPILWTSSLPDGIEKYLEAFEKDDIHFEYVNKNPECEDTIYADFKVKLYFAIGLDDKFGFLPDVDWEPIFDFLETIE